MSNDIFNWDEIWFVAKGREQNFKLCSLAEVKNTKGEFASMDVKYDKQDLEGNIYFQLIRWLIVVKG